VRFKSWLRGLILPLALALAFVAGRAVASQVHMRNALGALQRAYSELQQADRDKGGHRTAAVHDVELAIDEVQLGLQFAAEHGEG
jgi:hypothetical protein